MLWSGTRLLCLAATASSVLAVDPRCWRSSECTGPQDSVFKGSWEYNIYAPSSRHVRPKKVLTAAGFAVGDFSLPTELRGNGTTVVFDFGYEVGGIISLEYTSTGPARIGLAFSESKNWIGQWSDSSNGKFRGPDGAVYAEIENEEKKKTKYTLPDKFLRG